MKTLGGASLLGLIVAMLLIYWLRPLNVGAMALVLLLCLSTSSLVAGILARRNKKRTA
jgi:hypothetical protein